MGRMATHGLSKHKAKGYRISLGKKPDGGYRTFWLGKHRPTAEYHAEQVRGQFSHMEDAGRDVWTDKDLGVVSWTVDQYRALTARNRLPPHRPKWETSEARQPTVRNRSLRIPRRSPSQTLHKRMSAMTTSGACGGS
jgi:hypothetical protein